LPPRFLLPLFLRFRQSFSHLLPLVEDHATAATATPKSKEIASCLRRGPADLAARGGHHGAIRSGFFCCNDGAGAFHEFWFPSLENWLRHCDDAWPMCWLLRQHLAFSCLALLTQEIHYTHLFHWRPSSIIAFCDFVSRIASLNFLRAARDTH
jgi:hypothetical protein